MTSPTTIDDLGIDALQNIVTRLSSVDFASADCVSRLWNHVCGRVLYRPKLASACSFSHSLQVAVEDVVNKVILELIRPHFAIASIFRFDLVEAHQLITTKLGSKFPVITNCPPGIFTGENKISSEFKETVCTWKDGSIKEDFDPSHVLETEKGGIMLTIGFVPGLKLKTISLPKQNLISQDSQAIMIDKFITDIRESSTSISGCQSPAAIMIFSEPQAGLDYAVMEKMETVMVGYQCEFQHTNGSSSNINDVEEHASAAIALVFVKDTNEPPGIGKTEFHVVLSSELVPKGPVYAASFKERSSIGTRLFARREGPHDNLDGETLLNEAFDDISDIVEDGPIFIGVSKRRKCHIGWMNSLAFYEIFRFNREFISVYGTDIDIKTGDTFRLYYPDPTTVVSNDLRSFKQWSTTRGDKWEVFGGLIFTSSVRSKLSIDQPKVDTSLYLFNFPEVTLGRAFYGQIFVCGDFRESQEHKSVRCCMNEFCVAFLIMSYTP